MDLLKVLLLLFCGYAMVLTSEQYQYHVIRLWKSWFEAQQYCRLHFHDLATFSSESVSQRPVNFPNPVWIGLFDDPGSWDKVMTNQSNSWRWSATGTTSTGGYQHWRDRDPNFRSAAEQCVVIRNGLWRDRPCSSRNRFVCFRGMVAGQKRFTYNSTPVTWKEAQSHCRQHHTDLALIENASENSAVEALVQPDTRAWVGLFRRPWRWSDGNDSPVQLWASGQPDNDGKDEHCVLEKDDLGWHDAPCSEKNMFLCQGVLSEESDFEVNLDFVVKLQSVVDVSDPDSFVQISHQLTVTLQDQGLDLRVSWKTPPQK